MLERSERGTYFPRSMGSDQISAFEFSPLSIFLTPELKPGGLDQLLGKFLSLRRISEFPNHTGLELSIIGRQTSLSEIVFIQFKMRQPF